MVEGTALVMRIPRLSWFLTLVPDALGEGAGPLAGDLDKSGVPRNLVQHGQDSLRLRQKAAVEVGFKLQQGVVDSQAVVLHPPRNQVHMLLLARQPLKNLQQLGRRRIQSVVELCFVNLGA
jgi:hypothetical protein